MNTKTIALNGATIEKWNTSLRRVVSVLIWFLYSSSRWLAFSFIFCEFFVFVVHLIDFYEISTIMNSFKLSVFLLNHFFSWFRRKNLWNARMIYRSFQNEWMTWFFTDLNVFCLKMWFVSLSSIKLKLKNRSG